MFTVIRDDIKSVKIELSEEIKKVKVDIKEVKVDKKEIEVKLKGMEVKLEHVVQKQDFLAILMVMIQSLVSIALGPINLWAPSDLINNQAP